MITASETLDEQLSTLPTWQDAPGFNLDFGSNWKHEIVSKEIEVQTDPIAKREAQDQSVDREDKEVIIFCVTLRKGSYCCTTGANGRQYS